VRRQDFRCIFRPNSLFPNSSVQAVRSGNYAWTSAGGDARTTAGLPPQRRRSVAGGPGLEAGATLRRIHNHSVTVLEGARFTWGLSNKCKCISR
jgi:hypothetical protein